MRFLAQGQWYPFCVDWRISVFPSALSFLQSRSPFSVVCLCDWTHCWGTPLTLDTCSIRNRRQWEGRDFCCAVLSCLCGALPQWQGGVQPRGCTLGVNCSELELSLPICSSHVKLKRCRVLIHFIWLWATLGRNRARELVCERQDKAQEQENCVVAQLWAGAEPLLQEGEWFLLKRDVNEANPALVFDLQWEAPSL